MLHGAAMPRSPKISHALSEHGEDAVPPIEFLLGVLKSALAPLGRLGGADGDRLVEAPLGFALLPAHVPFSEYALRPRKI